MAVSVKIPTQLRAATDGESQATVDGSTVGGVSQTKLVRKGSLDKKWGAAADAAARAAASEIVKLLPR